MKIVTIYFTLILIAFAALGCTLPTHYQAGDYRGEGYFERRLSDDRFVVSFQANDKTEIGVAKRFALRRASEVTTNYGYRYFTILSEKQDQDVEISIHCFNDRPKEKGAIDAYRFLSYGALY